MVGLVDIRVNKGNFSESRVVMKCTSYCISSIIINIS
ncbi:hypothetical protein GBAR_LOCUS28161 [Geodia barretti]|uniref:Uncharacterized protein n=1 Tax=Geodia barretti TaxID=519541 RepID=A0AA35XH95_GEOBA|nr:hypothetical protein GBAR_LOCUS28161 [Geodia barretti]